MISSVELVLWSPWKCQGSSPWERNHSLRTPSDAQSNQVWESQIYSALSLPTCMEGAAWMECSVMCSPHGSPCTASLSGTRWFHRTQSPFTNGFESGIKWVKINFNLWFLWVIKLHYSLPSMKNSIYWIYFYLFVHTSSKVFVEHFYDIHHYLFSLPSGPPAPHLPSFLHSLRQQKPQ